MVAEYQKLEFASTPHLREGITDIQSMPQAQYDALEEKSPTTIYMIVDDVQDDDKA